MIFGWYCHWTKWLVRYVSHRNMPSGRLGIQILAHFHNSHSAPTAPSPAQQTVTYPSDSEKQKSRKAKHRYDSEKQVRKFAFCTRRLYCTEADFIKLHLGKPIICQICHFSGGNRFLLYWMSLKGLLKQLWIPKKWSNPSEGVAPCQALLKFYPAWIVFWLLLLLSSSSTFFVPIKCLCWKNFRPTPTLFSNCQHLGYYPSPFVNICHTPPLSRLT